MNRARERIVRDGYGNKTGNGAKAKRQGQKNKVEEP